MFYQKFKQNIQNLERFIENEYLKSFHEKIVVSLKSNFGFNTFVPRQWDFNGHYIRVTTDGYNINDTDIYISNGIGESLINIRFNSIPSINFYRLNKK